MRRDGRLRRSRGADLRRADLHVAPGRNDEWHDTRYRFGYTSLVTPGSTYDVDVATGERGCSSSSPCSAVST